MKYLLLFATMFCFLSVNAQKTAEKAKDVFGTPKVVVNLKVNGMTCDGCATHLQNELEKKAGIVEKEVSFPKQTAVVTYDPDKISEAEIIKAIEETGYTAEVVKKKE